MTRMIIGVGNPARGDDGAGVEVAHRLGSGVVAHTPFQLMDLWEGADDVVVIDAARSDAPSGTIYRFEIGIQPLPTDVLTTSTHSVGVVEVIELARTLHRLPERLLVYGIEVGDISHNASLTPEVEAAVTRLVAELGHA
jgi:hydrogenase maturation protease